MNILTWDWTYRWILVAAALAACLPSAGPVFRFVDRCIAVAARRPARGALVAGLLTLVACALPFAKFKLPAPIVHDEFSYIFAAETYLHGRLTNPPHPMWRHFETFHEIMRPTYMSKFPPGPGLAIAAGLLLTGLPIVGVWLALSLAVAATFWMCRAVMPGRWAMLASLVAAIHPMPQFWSQTYWGGSVAMLGGALLGGGALRAWGAMRGDARKLAISSGVAMGAGASILANSRPLEGGILALMIGLLLIARAFRSGARAAAARRLFARIVLPAFLVLAPTMGAMAYNNYRITGSATTLPYTLYTRQYMTAPLFFWQLPPNPPPAPQQRIMAKFSWNEEFVEYAGQIDLKRRFSGAIYAKSMPLIALYLLNPILLFVLLAPALLPLPVRNWLKDDLRFLPGVLLCAGLCVAVPLVQEVMTPWMRPHYMGVMMPYLVVVFGQGMRRLSGLTIDRPGIELGAMRVIHAGRALLRASLIVLVAYACHNSWQLSFNNQSHPLAKRVALLGALAREPGRHLVIVHYERGHSPYQEWVYNEPDIDGSKIVMARSLGAASDDELRRYFRDRNVWDLTFPEGEPRLQGE